MHLCQSYRNLALEQKWPYSYVALPLGATIIHGRSCTGDSIEEVDGTFGQRCSSRDISGYHSKVIMGECNLEGIEFLQKRIHSCASLVVSYVTSLITSLENFRNQLTLYLLLIGTFIHGRVIFHPLGTQPWGDFSFRTSPGRGLFPQNAYAWKPRGPDT